MTHEVVIDVPDGCDVEGADGTVTIEVAESEYVLAAARDRGIWLPADCQQGWCTTCAARLLAGEVDQSDSRRFYDVDAEAGYALICTARPRSDLRLRACQHGSMLDHRAAHGLPPGVQKR